MTNILDELEGKSASEVADYIRSKGIKGIRSNPHKCPIAQLHGRGTIVNTWKLSDVYGDVYPLPDGVITFIRKFDDGAYPDLEVKCPL